MSKVEISSIKQPISIWYPIGLIFSLLSLIVGLATFKPVILQDFGLLSNKKDIPNSIMILSYYSPVLILFGGALFIMLFRELLLDLLGK